MNNRGTPDEGIALSVTHPGSDGVSEIEQPALAPADGGKAAWLMLASSCLIQVPVWGL